MSHPPSSKALLPFILEKDKRCQLIQRLEHPDRLILDEASLDLDSPCPLKIAPWHSTKALVPYEQLPKLYLDIETLGLDPTTDRIIAIDFGMNVRSPTKSPIKTKSGFCVRHWLPSKRSSQSYCWVITTWPLTCHLSSSAVIFTTSIIHLRSVAVKNGLELPVLMGKQSGFTRFMPREWT